MTTSSAAKTSPPRDQPRGLDWVQSRGQWILTAGCPHQHGRLYVVEGAELNWVCSAQQRPAHSLAGFLRRLVELDDPRIRELMQQWGIYYRELPLAEEEREEEPQSDG